MPGLTGFVELGTPRSLSADWTELLTNPLLHETHYSIRPITMLPGGYAAVIDPNIDERLCGTVFRPGISVGFYGEFYNDGLRGLTTSAEIAARLADLYI